MPVLNFWTGEESPKFDTYFRLRIGRRKLQYTVTRNSNEFIKGTCDSIDSPPKMATRNFNPPRQYTKRVFSNRDPRAGILTKRNRQEPQ